MKKIGLLFILVNATLLAPVFSQNSTLGIEFGYRGYQMNDLKTLTEATKESLPFDAKITDNYPAYFNYGLFLHEPINNKVGIGFRYAFNSTGSRISLKDYSGEYLFDSKIGGHTISTYLTQNVYELDSNTWINFVSDFGCVISDLSLSESLEVPGAVSQSATYDFHGYSFFVDPGLEAKYAIKRYVFGVRMGYQIDVKKGMLKLDTNSEAILASDEGEAIKPDWSGFHIGVSFALKINK